MRKICSQLVTLLQAQKLYSHVERRLPTLRLPLGGRKQAMSTPGGYWIWGAGGMTLCPSLHSTYRGSCDRNTTEPGQHSTNKMLWQRHVAPNSTLGTPKEPSPGPDTGHQLPEGPPKETGGRRPGRATEHQNAFLGLEPAAHEPKAAGFLAQNNSQVILAEGISKIYFKTITLV